MARYTGPRTKIARKFGEPIFGPDKVLEKKNYPPGMHGSTKNAERFRNMGSSYSKSRKPNSSTECLKGSSQTFSKKHPACRV